ncbi:hypothetical protein lerEdw1_011284 [Lerista edwardsae]|nr:hypothetical protein lerEdw1_011284 [Lerista edwardsae]
MEGDSFVLRKKIRQHLGNDDGDVPDFQEGEITQEEVHGLVEVAVESDDKDDDEVFHEGQQGFGTGMELENQTRVKEFILLGFPTIMELQVLLFIVFLVGYILTLLQNIVIIAVIRTNSQLHKPMYFFLSHLSFLETWYISVTVPKLLVNFLSENKSISFEACMAQLYFFIALVCTECVLLAVMAYDRYVAICNPLRYPVVMSADLCLQLAVGSWLAGFLISMPKPDQVDALLSLKTWIFFGLITGISHYWGIWEQLTVHQKQCNFEKIWLPRLQADPAQASDRLQI